MHTIPQALLSQGDGEVADPSEGSYGCNDAAGESDNENDDNSEEGGYEEESEEDEESTQSLHEGPHELTTFLRQIERSLQSDTQTPPSPSRSDTSRIHTAGATTLSGPAVSSLRRVAKSPSVQIPYSLLHVHTLHCCVNGAVVCALYATSLVCRTHPSVVRCFVSPTAFPRFRRDTILFCNVQDDTSKHNVALFDQNAAHRLSYFKLHKAVRHSCVLGAMKRAGLMETKKANWNIFWGRRIKDEEYSALNPYQKINHFPGTWNIGRKDALVRGVCRMRRHFGPAFSFIPQTFLLPHDASLLEVEMARCPGHPFIVKPPASSCGKGIFLISSTNDIPKQGQYLVQKYITNPLTVGGYKCDLRLYVAVTSYDPLRIYIFKDGLVRFATEKLKKGDAHLGNRFMHLTNYSVNRKSYKYQRNTSAKNDDTGSKWSLKGLARYLAKKGHDWDATWARIKDVVTKTCLTCESTVVSKIGMYVKHRNTCFELYGFDILLTSNFIPYLLEVNIMPALSCSSPLDRQIKSAVVSNLLNLIGLQPFDRHAFNAEEESRKKTRLLGFASENTIEKKPKTRADRNRANNIATCALGATRGKRGGKDGTPPEAIPVKTQIDFASLGAFELDIIRDAEDEYYRRGAFERVFPTRVSCETFGSYFETTRYCNTLLGQWEKEKARFHDEDRRQLLRWLQGAGPYPGGQRTSRKAAPTVRRADHSECTPRGESLRGFDKEKRIRASSVQLYERCADGESDRVSRYMSAGRRSLRGQKGLEIERPPDPKREGSSQIGEQRRKDRFLRLSTYTHTFPQADSQCVPLPTGVVNTGMPERNGRPRLSVGASLIGTQKPPVSAVSAAGGVIGTAVQLEANYLRSTPIRAAGIPPGCSVVYR